MKDEKRFFQSYLYTPKGNYFISTAYRESSAATGGWYYETYAWKLGKDNERLEQVADNSGALSPKGAFDQHMEVARQLEEKGEFKEKE